MNACNVCGSTDLGELAHLADVPIHCNLFYGNADAARRAPRAALELVFCRACGHIHNRQFDPGRLSYGPDYENSQAFSPRFAAYLRSLARGLARRHRLRRKYVLEIGCGQGDFLTLLCEPYRNRCMGIDPGYRSRNARPGRNIRIVRERVNASVTSFGDYHLVAMRHLLEHLEQPLELLRQIRRRVKSGPRPVLYCEVPNSEPVINGLRVWDFLYEHCSYFGRNSFGRLLGEAGFRVTALRAGFNGQFLCCEAVPGRTTRPRRYRIPQSALETLHGRMDQTLSRWRRRLGSAKKRGERIGLWGAGSKGVMLANQAPSGSLACLIDLNPYKQGKFVSGTGDPILAPASLRRMKLDQILIANAAYLPEIKKQIARLGCSCRLVQV